MQQRDMKSPPLASEFVTEFLLLCFLGLVVAFAMLPLLHLEFVHDLDRSVSDLLMRQLAREQLNQPKDKAPRIVFVDVTEDTCQNWADNQSTSCTLSMTTPRDHLTQIVGHLTNPANNVKLEPSLVVIDIDLAPLPRRKDQPYPDPTDIALCEKVFNLAHFIPVIVVRPISIGRDSIDPSGVFIRAYPSVFDATSADLSKCDGEHPGSELPATHLWFASPVLQPDMDGIIRSVHAWDMVRDAKTGDRGTLAGIGFLAAALMDPATDSTNLACNFLASRAPPKNCSRHPVPVGGQTYEPSDNKPSRIDRLLFLLPYEEPWQSRPSSYGYNPSVIDEVDAGKLGDANGSELAGSVVVIGGSYYASNDLHVTPLGSDMPGAMVHANAIRAYATNRFVTEEKSWPLKFLLIATTALIGAIFHVLGTLAQCRLNEFVGDLVRISILLAGAFVAVFFVLLIGLFRGFEVLAETGTALGTLTPVLAVAFEGLCGVLHELRHLGISMAWQLWRLINGGVSMLRMRLPF